MYTLLLDSSIRNWVVLPMILIVLFVGIARHYVSQVIKSQPVVNEDSMKDIRIKQTLMSSSRLRFFGKFINEKAYNMRKEHLTRAGKGLLREKVSGPVNPMQSMSNPTAMVDMLKGNMTNMLPNIAVFTFVNYMFNGFICLKIPFPMPSVNFKSLVHKGVDLSSLNVSYVSSISWYFIVQFGLNGIYPLLLGEGSEVDQAKMMQMQMGGMGGMMGGFDASAAYKAEKENFKITKHEWIASHIERTLLGDRYPYNK